MSGCSKSSVRKLNLYSNGKLSHPITWVLRSREIQNSSQCLAFSSRALGPSCQSCRLRIGCSGIGLQNAVQGTRLRRNMHRNSQCDINVKNFLLVAAKKGFPFTGELMSFALLSYSPYERPRLLLALAGESQMLNCGSSSPSGGNVMTWSRSIFPSSWPTTVPFSAWLACLFSCVFHV